MRNRHHFSSCSRCGYGARLLPVTAAARGRLLSHGVVRPLRPSTGAGLLKPPGRRMAQTPGWLPKLPPATPRWRVLRPRTFGKPLGQSRGAANPCRSSEPRREAGPAVSRIRPRQVKPCPVPIVHAALRSDRPGSVAHPMTTPRKPAIVPPPVPQAICERRRSTSRPPKTVLALPGRCISGIQGARG